MPVVSIYCRLHRSQHPPQKQADLVHQSHSYLPHIVCMLPMWVVLFVLPLPICSLYSAQHLLQGHLLLLLWHICIIRLWHPHPFILQQVHGGHNWRMGWWQQQWRSSSSGSTNRCNMPGTQFGVGGPSCRIQTQADPPSVVAYNDSCPRKSISSRLILWKPLHICSRTMPTAAALATPFATAVTLDAIRLWLPVLAYGEHNC